MNSRNTSRNRSPASRRARGTFAWLAAAWALGATLLLPRATFGQTNFAVLANDGAWTWYNDQRALFHRDVLYFGYVRNSDGKTVLSAFDPRTGLNTNLWSSSLVERDDHNVPSLLDRDDGRLLAAYSRHGTDSFFHYRIANSDSPASAADWSEEKRGPDTDARMTYANLFQLSNEGGRIYNFARNLNFNPTVFISTNGGAAWSAPKTFIQTGPGSVRPYVKFCSDGKRRIDFLYTDGHPRDVSNSLYHLYYQAGSIHRTDGTQVRRFAELPVLHDAGQTGSLIYQYNEAPQSDPDKWIPFGRAWCWEIAGSDSGHPVCVFTVRSEHVTGMNWFDNRIYYYYARWDGAAWRKHLIAQAGRPLYETEGDYAGGICIDPQNPNVIYLSSNAADPFKIDDLVHVSLRPENRYELWRGTTTDGGKTFAWQAVTTNSASDNLRPFVPRAHNGTPAVLWFRGTYRSYTSYQCQIVGLFSTAISESISAVHARPFGILTNAAQVRGLTPAEATTHFPVKLNGVVLVEPEPEGDSLTMLDDTAGLYLRGPAAMISKIRRGERIEIEGTSDPGEFAPFVWLTSVTRLGPGEIPPPRPVTFEQLITGRPDAQWVEVSGVVRNCEPILPDGKRYKLELVTGGGRLATRINAPAAESLIDAEVRLRGVCFYQVNKGRQVISPLLLVPPDVPVVIETPAPVDPYAAETKSIGSLLQFAPQGAYGHRVHVRGVVTHHNLGESLWIRDETHGLRAQIRQKESLQPGDVVDVLGFPNRGGYSPMLEDAVFQKHNSGAAPAPRQLTDATAALNYDAELIAIEAMLTAQQSAADGWALIMQTKGGGTFRALLRVPPNQPPPVEWQAGSRVRVTGICSVAADQAGPPTGLNEPRSFQILLRSSADLLVIEPPPWWTWERIVWLLSAIACALLLAVAAVMWIARQRLREKGIERARAEAEFSAILAERNRMAREIHDTLAQGLGAISMQLELVKSQIAPDANGANRHLEQAHELVRHSLSDARNSIWNMRSQVLETGDLASALTGVLHQLADGTEVEAKIDVQGRPRRLPPVTENNLLRIGQEAITNSMKHAHAKRIEVELEFAEKEVRLRVNDNGKGFNAARPPIAESGFGLLGMRERADQLQAKLTVQSDPGRGTEVKLIVPITG